MTGQEMYNIIKKNVGMGGSKPRAYCGMSSGAWCNAYVCYAFNQAGQRKLYYGGKKVTYCPTSIKWCEANLAQIPPYLAMPCDVIYFDWQPNGRPDHIGFVKAKRTTDSVFTHEGNTSGGKVAEKTRPAKYIEGIFRPHFTAKGLKKEKIAEDGDFGYKSIYNLQCALGMKKPDGILGKGTVKAWQKKVGASADGAWGRKTSLKAQKFLKVKQDGAFGKNSVKAWQKWINGVNFPQKKTVAKKTTTSSSSATKPAPKPVAKPVTTEAKAYTGKFPALNTNTKIVNGMAYRMCYPYGTPQKKYTYKSGKPTEAYKKGIDKIFPKHKSWSNKKQRVGACCDVFVAVCLGYVGIKVKKDLKNQLVDMPKMTKQLKSNGHYRATDFKLGDVVQRGRKDKSGHTWVVCELVNGKKYIANAHYKHLNGCYAVMDAKPKNIVKSKWKYYKCYTVQGAIRTYYRHGDYGYDVLYIQKFLNWYGIKCTADGDFGAKTKSAVEAYQKKRGLTVNGYVGKTMIADMKKVKK